MPNKKAKLPLSKTHPELAKEANGWDPTLVSYGSKKVFEWKCTLGHIYETSPNSRTNMKSGCPYCSNTKVLKGFNDLATTHPEIAHQAHGWDPSNVVTGSHDSKLWKCNLGHSYKAIVNSRTYRGDDCSVCSGKTVLKGFNDLASRHPELANEANGWDPSEFTFGSKKNKDWKCNKGHVWPASIANRTNLKSGCPYCSNNKVLKGYNDLATTNPDLAQQADGWDPSKYSSGSERNVKWICTLGHKWNYPIKDRSRGDNCPFCSGKRVLKGFNDLETKNPNLAKEAFGWDPSTVTIGSGKEVKWQCSLGHKWIAQVVSRAITGSGCPSCAKSGFDPNKDGYLYFLNHDRWQMFQIGITNVPNDRLADHERLGWEIFEVRGPMDGQIIQQWETAILRMLRKKGADLSNSNIAGKFDGYSESWSKSTFPVQSIKELMILTEEFEDNK